MERCRLCDLPVRLCAGPEAHQTRRSHSSWENQFKDEFRFFSWALTRLTDQELRSLCPHRNWRVDFMFREIAARRKNPELRRPNGPSTNS